MKQAVATVGTTDFGLIVQRYRGPLFGFASQNFYAEFLAALELSQNYKQYFGDLLFAEPSRPVSIEANTVGEPSTFSAFVEPSRPVTLEARMVGELNPAIDRPAGPIDPDVAVLAVQRAAKPAGQPLALFASYALHYVGGNPGTDVSADYFGVVGELLHDRLGAPRHDARQPHRRLALAGRLRSGLRVPHDPGVDAERLLLPIRQGRRRRLTERDLGE